MSVDSSWVASGKRNYVWFKLVKLAKMESILMTMSDKENTHTAVCNMDNGNRDQALGENNDGVEVW